MSRCVFFGIFVAAIITVLSSERVDAKPPAISANDLARYVAGLPVSQRSPLYRLTKESHWIRHAKTLDKAWGRIEDKQIRRIKAWSRKYIRRSQDLMLYMFSGPDYLYADAFFPNASVYVLSALEPIGPIPDVRTMSRGSRAGSLQNLRASMQSVLSFSFFITKQMKSQLRETRLQGTLPLLYVFLARSGKTVEKTVFVTLNKNGSLSTRERRLRKGASNGVKILFSDRNGRKRTLYYFQTDLSNGGLRKSGFRKFCTKLGAADSLIKSASYLLHSGNFSEARKFLLQQSAVLVQDDSGIPLRFIPRKQWDLRPFGYYLGPIDLFADRYQRDMRNLFVRSRATPIDFGVGYRWRRNQSNLLLAIKRFSR